MSSNTENTEAKLAAYIDGQLDPAERAQIEQYLAANPDHRKLLADMTAQRELLRALPREKAPNDIYDALQSQLERSVLLDDSAQAAPVAVRHSRRSQLFSLAAMVFLAIGLGAVLYFALPSSKPTPVEVASTAAPHPEQPTTEESGTLDKAKLSDPKLNFVASAALSDKTPATSAIAAAPALRELGGVFSNGINPNPTADAISGEFKAMNKELAEAGQEPLVVLVSTDNPSRTSLQVASYLQSNNIRWEAVNAPAQDFSSKRQTPTSASIAPAAAVSTKPESGPVISGDADGDGVVNGTLTANRRLEGKSADTSTDDLQLKKSDTYRYPNQKDSLTPSQQKAVANYFNSIEQDTSKDKDQARQLIIARRMTRQQAVQLTDTLSTERGTQRARLLTDIPSQPTYGARKFESQDASISVAQYRSQAPTQSQAQSQSQSPDTGEVQGYGKFLRQNDNQAQSQAQTQQAPAREQNEAQVTTNATAPEDRAAEQSALRDRAAGNATAAAPPAGAVQSVPAAAPTTQSDEPIDVVILVQDEQPTTAPSTQSAPSSQPATEPAF